MSGDDPLTELLLSMPSDGAWMNGSGPHTEALTILLDEKSSLVEENVMSDDEDLPWMVRLTAAGMAMRAALVAATVEPFGKADGETSN